MNLKKISKFILLFFLSILFSCSELAIYEKEKSNINFNQNDKEELNDVIINTNKITNLNFKDYYSRNKNYSWNNATKLNKKFTISLGAFSEIGSNVSNFIINDKFVYYIDNKNNFIQIDLLNGEIIKEIKLALDIDYDLNLPISIAKTNNFFFASFANGTIVKFDTDGKIYWNLEFNDLIKTPIKILNNEIIVIFNSNKIISIEIEDGSLLWQYNYELDKPSLSIGGEIISRNNLLHFVMPNSRLGAIDTILGEKIDLTYISKIKQEKIFNNNYQVTIHFFENIFSLIENNDTFHTYDLYTDKFFIIDEKIFSITSYFFLNNSLIVLDNKSILKAYNLVNKKIFWQINLSKILQKNEKIIQSFISNDSVIVFFSKGNILQINKFNGEIEFNQNLKLNNISYITSFNDNLIFSLENGKTIFYKQ